MLVYTVPNVPSAITMPIRLLTASYESHYTTIISCYSQVICSRRVGDISCYTDEQTTVGCHFSAIPHNRVLDSLMLWLTWDRHVGQVQTHESHPRRTMQFILWIFRRHLTVLSRHCTVCSRRVGRLATHCFLYNYSSIFSLSLKFRLCFLYSSTS